MNAVDWTVAFERAARQGPHALVRALQAAVEHERAAYDALFARQRATCDEILAQQRAGCDAILARQRADCDTILARQRAEFEQRFAALRRELLAKTANELSALRRELTPAPPRLACPRP